jgi:hypothetical protein
MKEDIIVMGPRWEREWLTTTGAKTTAGTASSSGGVSGLNYGAASSKLGLAKAGGTTALGTVSSYYGAAGLGSGSYTYAATAWTLGGLVFTAAVGLVVGLVTYAITKSALEP